MMNKAQALFCFLAVVLLTSTAPAADLPTLRFDMGTSQSPVAPGFLKVIDKTAFSEKLGYGWISRGQESFDVEKPAENPAWLGPAGQRIPRDYVIYKEHTPVTRDGVRSRDDLVFQVRVPDGVYRLAVTLGDLERPIHSLQIFVNDQLLASDVDAKHVISRACADLLYGFPRKVRLTVDVKDGKGLNLRIHGDDSGFRARFLEEFNKPMPISYLRGDPSGIKKAEKPDLSKWGLDRDGSHAGEVWVFQDIGGPFTQNSLMAVEIYPFVKPPLWREAGSLTAGGADASLRKAVALFNEKRFAEAEKAFDGVADDYSRALGYLWLAGQPNYEEEKRLVPKALKILEGVSAREANNLMFVETLESARRMDKAIYRFENRARQNRTYTELLLISGEVGFIQPEDPTYYKGLMYAGRGLFMVIPHRWQYTAGMGRQCFQKVRDGGFGDNRFVRWYLDDVWTEHQPDWVYKDYSKLKQGAPDWAANVYESFNREVDLAEWWIQNRQAADGSLGGGWGDDVEILRSLGTFGSICADASPMTLEGTRKVSNGAWNSGSVDKEGGYFADVGDTEHSGEWTADTLVPMMHIDFGNPVWVERGMKTGRLMRDLWMDFNSKGHFWIRSNYLGALGVGSPIQQSDSRINYRPAAPARAAYWYNGLPSLEKLFVQWADSWLAVSMSTERGKPRGIIPQEVAFEDSLIGGVKSPSWFKTYDGPGTDNYDWQGTSGYHDAIVDLFLLAYRATGDRKYLEPLDLEAAFVREHCPQELLIPGSAASKDKFYIDKLTPGSNEWIGAYLKNWPAEWDKIQTVIFAEPGKGRERLWSLQEASSLTAEESNWARRRWPHVTTECIATDRVSWPGMGTALRVMTAFGGAGHYLQVSYRGLGREFAAVVQEASGSYLRVVLYNMSGQDKQAAIVPWILQTGAEYVFRAGPSRDPETGGEKLPEQAVVRIANSGQDVSFLLPARTPFVVELERKAGVAQRGLTPDVALSAEDMFFNPPYRRVEVTVHNIGSEPARDVLVVLLSEGQEIGRVRIPHIAAPLDLDPKTVRVSFAVQPTGQKRRFTVRLDPEGAIQEITKRNNEVSVDLDLKQVPAIQHSSP